MKKNSSNLLAVHKQPRFGTANDRNLGSFFRKPKAIKNQNTAIYIFPVARSSPVLIYLFQVHSTPFLPITKMASGI